MNYYNSSNFIAYRIAENFCEENFCGMLTCLPTDAMPQNFAEKTFANSHKTSKFVKLFSLKGFLPHGMLCRICIVYVLLCVRMCVILRQ